MGDPEKVVKQGTQLQRSSPKGAWHGGSRERDAAAFSQEVGKQG